jgi:hypothetical protein
MTRTIQIPYYGDTGALHQPVQIPEPGEPDYITPAERFAQAADPVQQAIAGEQAIAERLELAELAEAAEAEPEAGL